MTRIDALEAFVLRRDLAGRGGAERYRASPSVRSVYPNAHETVFVRVEAEGLVGWGEALAPVAPEAVAAIIEHLFVPLVVGRDLDGVRPVTRHLRDVMRERGHQAGHHADAVAAVDIALWDLEGKLLNAPVHRLLGGAERDRLPVYLTNVVGETAHEKADSAAAAWSEGIRRFKLHLPDQPRETLAIFDAVRAALPDGDEAQIAVDAHWQLSYAQARWLGDALAERGGWFLEAPLAPEDRAGHERLGRTLSIPVAIGEAMRNRFEFADWSVAGAMGIGQPDIGRTGIGEGADIAALLASRFVPIAPHHSLATGVAFMAACHVAAAAESLEAIEYSPLMLARSDGLVTNGMFAAQDAPGGLPVPTAPGLGIEVDEAEVRRAAAASDGGRFS